MAEQDDDLELKKRARRRLVGAIAFALLAVALLPLVMDEEAPRIGSEIAIRIPEPQEPRLAPLTAQPERKPTAEKGEASQTGGDKTAEGRAAPAPSSAVGSAGNASSATTIQKPATGRGQAETTSKESAPVVQPAAEGTADEARRAQSILEGKAASEEFVLLIGAYANQANVTALTGKLAELDIPTYTETVTLPQGKRTRVRAGPFPSRETALQAQAKMKQVGVNGQVAVRP